MVIRSCNIHNLHLKVTDTLHYLEIFEPLECYTAYIGSYLTMFRDNLLAPSPRFRLIVPKRQYVTTNLRCVTAQKSEYLIYTVVEP